MNPIVILAVLGVIVCLTILIVWKVSEKYVSLRNIGSFHIRNKLRHDLIGSDDDPEHKYSGHRYDRHKRRYNFQSQKNRPTS